MNRWLFFNQKLNEVPVRGSLWHNCEPGMTNRRQVLPCESFSTPRESSVYMFPRLKFKRSLYATVVCRPALPGTVPDHRLPASPSV